MSAASSAAARAGVATSDTIRPPGVRAWARTVSSASPCGGSVSVQPSSTPSPVCRTDSGAGVPRTAVDADQSSPRR
ncbi:hypothetical protein GCM10009535_09790 [Streptomyces thermocarboxydovorans]|uniref:Uncharacterized protein n=1 Tax=Streptomyces thermocarboxydovorans TaxID=59298 RepID=A0ABN1HAU3_9ACTN